MKATYWIAPELDWVKKYTEQGQRAGELEKQFPDLSKVRGYPVVWVLEQVRAEGYLLKTTTRILSIQETDLPDSDFEIPPGYAAGLKSGAVGRKP